MDKKTSYYFGWGIAYGSLFGGLLSATFGKNMLIVYVSGMVYGGLIGFVYGKIKTKK